MSDLTQLKNLGPQSVQWLESAGITSADELRRLGSVLAYKIVKHRHPEVNLLMLYALEGALRDLPYNGLPPDLRAQLKADAEVPLRVGPA